MDIELLRQRARIIRTTRAFFDGKGYLELDTPLLSPDLIPETCLEVFKTAYHPPAHSAKGAARELYLIPSPEVWMKKVIAEHRVNVYQICKCFRNCESVGKTHSPEFTMVEFYTMDADYLDSLSLAEALFAALLADDGLRRFQGERALEALAPPFERLTMEEAFVRFAGFSLCEAIGAGALAARARELGMSPPEGASDADLYNLIFIHAVEHRLARDRPVALLDYPSIVPCLAEENEGGRGAPTKQRWELYARGLELANCYSEERDAGRVRDYFQEEGRLKSETALIKHAIDDDYWKLFAPRPRPSGPPAPFPRCSGVALGMDRLIMALTGRAAIDGVLAFSLIG